MFNPYYNPLKARKGRKLPTLTRLPSKSQNLPNLKDLEFILKYQNLASVEAAYATCESGAIASITYDRELPPLNLQPEIELTAEDLAELGIKDRYVRITHVNSIELPQPRYFFRSTATSREGNDLRGIWIPLEADLNHGGIILKSFNLSKGKGFILQYNKAESKYLQMIALRTLHDEALINQLLFYGRLIDKEHACLSKHLRDIGV